MSTIRLSSITHPHGTIRGNSEKIIVNSVPLIRCGTYPGARATSTEAMKKRSPSGPLSEESDGRKRNMKIVASPRVNIARRVGLHILVAGGVAAAAAAARRRDRGQRTAAKQRRRMGRRGGQ